MENKRGQGLSTTAIILIVLGVVVLVVLIVGFTIGWSKFAPSLSGNNVDSVVQACEAACSAGNSYDFCNAKKELKDAEKNKFTQTCAEFSLLSTYSKYGIKKCPSISNCNSNIKCGEYSVGDKSGVESATACGATQDDITLITTITNTANKFCCIDKK